MDRFYEELPELESRLLLYAEGELSPEEASAVEAELSRNPAAGAALESVRAMLAETHVGLSALDRAAPLSARVRRRAGDRAVSAVFQWVETEAHARTLRKSAHGSLRDGAAWRYARWPLAAAAALVVGLMLWTFGSEPTRLGPDVAFNEFQFEDPADPPEGPVAVAQTGDTRVEQLAAALFDNPAGRWDEDGDTDLSQLELGTAMLQELAAIRLLDEPDWEQP